MKLSKSETRHQRLVREAFAEAGDERNNGDPLRESRKLTRGQLQNLVKEEVFRARRLALNEAVRRLNELYPGSNLGSYLKQGITKLWEADNMFQRALQEAPDDATHGTIEGIHKQLEKLAFDIDGKMQGLVK